MAVKNVLISLALGILILVLGVWLGMSLGGQKSVGLIKSPQQTAANSILVKALSSKVIPSIAAYGQVTNITGNDLTINYQGDNIIISIGSNARVYSFVTKTATPVKTGTTTKTTVPTAPTSQQVAFKDIKVGDNVSINIKVLPTGQMQGLSVVILPAK